MDINNRRKLAMQNSIHFKAALQQKQKSALPIATPSSAHNSPALSLSGETDTVNFSASSRIKQSTQAPIVKFSGKDADNFADYYSVQARNIGKKFGIPINKDPSQFGKPDMVKAVLSNQENLNTNNPLLGMALEQILIAIVNHIDLDHSGWFSGKKEKSAQEELAEVLVDGLTHPYEEVSHFCRRYIMQHKPEILQREDVEKLISNTRSKEDAVKKTNTLFESLGVNYKVNRGNIYSPETMKRLLKSTPQNEEETTMMASMLKTIENELLYADEQSNKTTGATAIKHMEREFSNLTERLTRQYQGYLKEYCEEVLFRIENDAIQNLETSSTSSASEFELILKTNIKIQQMARQMVADIKMAAERNKEIQKYLDTEFNGRIPSSVKVLDDIHKEILQTQQNNEDGTGINQSEFIKQVNNKLYSITTYLTYGFAPLEEIEPVLHTYDDINEIEVEIARIKNIHQTRTRERINLLILQEVQDARMETAEERFKKAPKREDIVRENKRTKQLLDQAKTANNRQDELRIRQERLKLGEELELYESELKEYNKAQREHEIRTINIQDNLSKLNTILEDATKRIKELEDGVLVSIDSRRLNTATHTELDQPIDNKDIDAQLKLIREEAAERRARIEIENETSGVDQTVDDVDLQISKLDLLEDE